MAVAFRHHSLPNGLTIIAEPNPDSHTAAVGFFVRTGARDEERPVMGVSHFLEHMMFKGTARRTAEDVNREFDEMGANYNAYTSHEKTVYYAHVLPEFLPRSIDLLGDMLRPALREEDFVVEKKVILEEIGMYNDRPQWRLQDALWEQYFGKHPLGYRVLGTVDSITQLTVDQMRHYFAHRYSPDNIVVSASGKLDFEHLVDDVARITADWVPTKPQRTYEPVPIAARVHHMVDEKLNRHHVAVLCPGPSAQDESRYTARILSDVIGDSDGSRLYWALVDPGLADEAEFSAIPQDKVGCFLAYASSDPDRAVQVEDLLLKTLDNYAASIEPAEIERAKNKVATQATLAGESTAGRMSSLGSQWSNLGRYIPLSEELERIMAVTPGEIAAFLSKNPFTPRTIARLGPQKIGN